MRRGGCVTPAGISAIPPPSRRSTRRTMLSSPTPPPPVHCRDSAARGAPLEALPQEPDPLIDVIVEARLALELVARLRPGCVRVADPVEQVVGDSHGLVVQGGAGAVVRGVVSARVGQEGVAATERELF